MRATTYDFLINGEPVLVPDAGVGFSYEDLDDESSGRDEGGFMHRFIVRTKVGNWAFTYSSLTEEEKNYMESLFGNSGTFQFTHPSRMDSAVSETHTCYRSRVSLSWYNSKAGLWKNYKFNIIQC